MSGSLAIFLMVLVGTVYPSPIGGLYRSRLQTATSSPDHLDPQAVALVTLESPERVLGCTPVGPGEIVTIEYGLPIPVPPDPIVAYGHTFEKPDCTGQRSGRSTQDAQFRFLLAPGLLP